MIQLTRNGVVGSADIGALQDRFRRMHTFRLEGLIHKDLLESVSTRLDRSAWTFRRDGEVGTEASPEDQFPADILNFAANTPSFLDVMRQIAGFGDIKGFNGRVYRMAASEHRDLWHDDVSERFGRLVGMSINLSPVPYAGGVFTLRDRASEDIICALPNTGPGDAIFFRISPHLQHIVTPVESEASKTAFAGWFTSIESIHQFILAKPSSIPSPAV